MNNRAEVTLFGGVLACEGQKISKCSSKKKNLNFNNSQMLKVLYLAPALPQLLWCQELSAHKEARKWTESCRLRGLFTHLLRLAWLHLYPVIHIRLKFDDYSKFPAELIPTAKVESTRLYEIMCYLDFFFFRLLNLEDCCYFEQSLGFKAHHINMWIVQKLWKNWDLFSNQIVWGFFCFVFCLKAKLSELLKVF